MTSLLSALHRGNPSATPDTVSRPWSSYRLSRLVVFEDLSPHCVTGAAHLAYSSLDRQLITSYRYPFLPFFFLTILFHYVIQLTLANRSNSCTLALWEQWSILKVYMEFFPFFQQLSWLGSLRWETLAADRLAFSNNLTIVEDLKGRPVSS